MFRGGVRGGCWGCVHVLSCQSHDKEEEAAGKEKSLCRALQKRGWGGASGRTHFRSHPASGTASEQTRPEMTTQQSGAALKTHPSLNNHGKDCCGKEIQLADGSTAHRGRKRDAGCPAAAGSPLRRDSHPQRQGCRSSLSPYGSAQSPTHARHFLQWALLVT